MRHPVLGPVACLVAVKQIAKGEEVFIFITMYFWLPGIAKKQGMFSF